MVTIQYQTKVRIAAWLGVVLLTALITFGLEKITESKPHVAIEGDSQTNSLGTTDSTKDLDSIAVSSQLYQSSLVVSIYLSHQQKIARVPLESYIAGVVAAEMPVNFQLEALKAQAIAARTYIVRRIVNHDLSGIPMKGAQVTDTVVHQAYLTDQQLAKNWGQKNFQTNMKKINQAVNETRGVIITYANEPINATYFSTSNGFTENSEDYWGVYEPYLRSVASPWDRKISPSFNKTIEISITQFLLKLGLSNSKTTSKAIPASLSINVNSNVQISEGHRISSIKIAGKQFTGKEIRERLALASSAFTWQKKGNTMVIQTQGSGHGVGMSQWGANGMAQMGESAAKILQYYYKGIKLKSAQNLLTSYSKQ
ncbi:stage II sporulation protein D [Paenibacillus psychroresistens]|nr:stage II sporulation protein D [Paenibacillus psychroresistens]